MWTVREFRILRWFMAMAGVGLMIPGAIYAMSWPDTIRAFDGALGSALAVPAAVFSIAALTLGGLSFICGWQARAGAVVAAIALLLGSVVHYQWSVMMNQRLAMLPEALTGEERAMLTDTIQFAANAQMPHIMKNLVLVGVCAVVFVLGPRICAACKTKQG